MFATFGNKGFSPDLTPENNNLDITWFTIDNDRSSSNAICLGMKVSKAGDFNGDGYDDFMISTKCENEQFSNESKVYIVYGQKTFPQTTPIPLNYLNYPGYPDALIIKPTGKDFFGSRIASIGDFNGDSLPDVMISSMYFANTENAQNDIGGTYIVYGRKSYAGTSNQVYSEVIDLSVFIPGAGHHIAAIGDLHPFTVAL